MAKGNFRLRINRFIPKVNINCNKIYRLFFVRLHFILSVYVYLCVNFDTQKMLQLSSLMPMKLLILNMLPMLLNL